MEADALIDLAELRAVLEDFAEAAAKEYAYKLSTMKSKLEIEEEFVWIAP